MLRFGAMIMLRLRTLLLYFYTPLLICAQDRPEAVTAEIRNIGNILRSQPPEVAMRRIDSLLAVPDQDPLLIVGLYNFKGHAFRLTGRLDDAMAAQVRSYQLADSLNDLKGKIDAQIAIGIIHLDLDELKESKRTLLEVYKITEENPQLERNYRVPLVLGAIAIKSEQADSALFWYKKALPLSEAAKDSLNMCDIRYNIGIAYEKKGDHQASERYLLAAIDAIPEGGYPQLEARALEALASIYIKMKRWDEVPAYLDRAQEMAIQHGAGDALENVMVSRMRYLMAIGDSLKAFDVSQRLLAVKDSLSMVFRERTLAEVQANFDMARMEKELELTKAEAEVNKLRAQRSRIAWSALSVIAVLAIVLIVLTRRQYQLKKQTAVALEQDKERLLEENELLHQENLMARFETLKSQIDPHFLFNAMNTLYTLVETEPKKAREFVSSFSQLYRKVLTSRERTIVPVQEELELVHHYLFLQRIRFGESLQVTVEVPARALTGYLPPFTLQMLLENAIKHNVISAAHPLHIAITVEGDHLIVRNDLLARGTKEVGTGTGLDNIRRRYTMLGAQEPTFTVSDTHYTASVPILSQEP